MSITRLITENAIDLAKEFIFENGISVMVDFKDSVTGEKQGEIIQYRHDEKSNSIVLFIHGFGGNAADTFGCIPDMLCNEAELRGWDVYSLGYSSDVFPTIGKGLWSANPDLTKLSLQLKTLINVNFKPFKRVALVAHSMGGLIVQRMLLDLESDDLKKISHCFLLGVPSNGLFKASFFSFWSSQVKDLSADGTFIPQLRKDWNDRFEGHYPFEFYVVAGSKDEFVPAQSSLTPFDQKYHYIVEGNHINMIKPKDESEVNNPCFQLLLKGIAPDKIPLKGNMEELNILLGNYNEIINKYYDNRNALAVPQLIQLVFALENFNRNEDAIDILKNHPLLTSKSDPLGVLAGRYKRRYLAEGLQSDLQAAIDNYANALVIASSENNSEQIFYHAINLAFLSIVGEQDKLKMKKYAQLALDHCTSSHPDMWEVATIAEASMYLGDDEKALEKYKKAAEMANDDNRARNSIYLNALVGFKALNAGNGKVAFLERLGEVLVG